MDFQYFFSSFLYRSLYIFIVSYEESSIRYVWKNDEDTLRKSPSLTTLNAYLIQNETNICDVKGTWRGKERIFFKIKYDEKGFFSHIYINVNFL